MLVVAVLARLTAVPAEVPAHSRQTAWISSRPQPCKPQTRRALHISEGDEVEFAVHGDGTITVRGYLSIPTDQAWFFTPRWLAGEREEDEEITAGRGTVHESADDMFAHLDALTPDA